MKNWIPKKSLIMFSSAFSLGFFLIFISLSLFIFWQIDKIEKYYSDTESQSGKEERARAIKFFAESNKNIINKLREFFIANGDEVRFIEEIENAAKVSDLVFDIDQIDIQKNESETFKENIDVNIKFEGEWKNIMSFIDLLEKMQFGTYIYDVSLDNSNGKWSGFVKFLVFRERSI